MTAIAKCHVCRQTASGLTCQERDCPNKPKTLFKRMSEAQPQSLPEGMLPVKQEDIELLARLHELSGNSAASFTLRKVGAVGCVLADQVQLVAAHRLAAEARTRDAGWQPIETAPQIDLEYILASNGFWVEKVCFVPRTEGDGREGPGWIAHHGDVTPTHWMPLPKPSPRAALSRKPGS